MFADKCVAVVIVNWNGWTECLECISSLLAQEHDNFHIFIVDNASHDRSVERISTWCESPVPSAAWRTFAGVDRLTDLPDLTTVPHRVVERDAVPPPLDRRCRVTIVRSGGNLGFAGGCNVGIAAAGVNNFDYFWFLNADAVVDRRALVELIGRAERQADVGMVGSTIRYYDRPDVVQAMGGARLDRSNGNTRHIGEGASVTEVPTDASVVERDLAYVMGASMLVSRRYILEIGPMEEDYFLYFEDADWGMRGSGKFSFGYAPLSHVFHKWGANSHKASSSVSGYYYRNRLRFVTRFLPESITAAKLAMFEQLLRHIARGRWAEARLVVATLLDSHRIISAVKKKA